MTFICVLVQTISPLLEYQIPLLISEPAVYDFEGNPSFGNNNRFIFFLNQMPPSASKVREADNALTVNHFKTISLKSAKTPSRKGRQGQCKGKG